jgi:hypothetical protein
MFNRGINLKFINILRDKIFNKTGLAFFLKSYNIKIRLNKLITRQYLILVR